jgi:hypothetical protein
MAIEDARESALAIADDLLRASQREVGSNLIAVMLHGSLVSGDFVVDRSDIDLLVIVHGPLTAQQKSSLETTVTSLAHHRWLDYRVVTSESARQPSRSPMLDFYVGTHPDLPDGIEVNRDPMAEPDLLFEFDICRQEGRSLVGPRPADVIGAVPEDWLFNVGDQYLKRWQEIDYDEHSAELMVFTACRLWYRSRQHRHCTKSEAARWVMRQAPELRAPKLALEHRTTDATTAVSEADVMSLLTKVRTVLAQRHQA